MKRQLVYCSNTARTGEPLTPHNHHLFKFETSFQINPCEMLLIIPRNDEYSVLFQQGIYEKSCLKVVGNEMNGGLESCGLNSYWYGTLVILVCLSFNGGIVFLKAYFRFRLQQQNL